MDPKTHYTEDQRLVLSAAATTQFKEIMLRSGCGSIPGVRVNSLLEAVRQLEELIYNESGIGFEVWT